MKNSESKFKQQIKGKNEKNDVKRIEEWPEDEIHHEPRGEILKTKQDGIHGFWFKCNEEFYSQQIRTNTAQRHTTSKHHQMVDES